MSCVRWPEGRRLRRLRRLQTCATKNGERLGAQLCAPTHERRAARGEAAGPPTQVTNLRYREWGTADRLGTCRTKNKQRLTGWKPVAPRTNNG